MAQNSPPKAAESLDLLRLAAQFTWRSGRDLRLESIEVIDPGCPGTLIRALRGKRLDGLAEQALYPAERRVLSQRLQDHKDLADIALTLPGDGAQAIHVSLSANAIHDDAGRFMGYQGIGRAGTERPYDDLQRRELIALLQRAEAARDREAELRRESEALLASLQCLHESLPLAEKCRAILKSFESVLGYETAIVLRRGVNGILSAVASTLSDAGEVTWPEEPLIASALAGQASIREDIQQVVEPSALPRTLRRHARAALFAPLRIGREHAVLVALHSEPGTFGDRHISALRRLGLVAEQAFASEESKVAIVNASKLASLGEMLAVIAHEVNQPLSIIGVSAQNARMLVNASAPGADICEKLERIESQTRRAADIVKAIRMLAHPSRGGASVTDVAVADVMNGLRVLCEGTLRTKGIALEVNISPVCRTIRAHASGLEQVLLNLIVNARDAVSERMERQGTGEAGRISVTVEDLVEENRVRIRVADNGGGIPDDVIERIFDPFFTLKDVGKGTGLGLSICRTLLADMNAAMHVRNDGDGAVFEVDLPAAEL